MTTARSGATLASLLERNARRGTGCMQVADKDHNSGLVYFRDGQVYAVHIAGRSPQIARRLRAAGVLTPATYTEAVEAADGDPSSAGIGDRCVADGHLDAEVLNVIHQELLLSALDEIDTWTGLRSRFREDAASAEFCVAPLDVSVLADAMAQRAEYWEQTWAQIGNGLSIDEAAPANLHTGGQPDTPDGAALLAAIDGHRTVAALAKECGLTRMETVHLLHGMVTTGTVTLLAPDDPRPEPPQQAAPQTRRPSGRLPLSRPVAASPQIPPAPHLVAAPDPAAETTNRSSGEAAATRGDTARRRAAAEEAARLEEAARRAREEADRLAAEEADALVAAEREARAAAEQELTSALRAREQAEQAEREAREQVEALIDTQRKLNQAAQRVRWSVTVDLAQEQAQHARTRRDEAARSVGDSETTLAAAEQTVDASREAKQIAEDDRTAAEETASEAEQVRQQARRDLYQAEADETDALTALLRAQEAYEQARDITGSARAAFDEATDGTFSALTALAGVRQRAEQAGGAITVAERDVRDLTERLEEARSRLEAADSEVGSVQRRVEEAQARLDSL